jgi:hypothetical protein
MFCFLLFPPQQSAASFTSPVSLHSRASEKHRRASVLFRLAFASPSGSIPAVETHALRRVTRGLSAHKKGRKFYFSIRLKANKVRFRQQVRP